MKMKIGSAIFELYCRQKTRFGLCFRWEFECVGRWDFQGKTAGLGGEGMKIEWEEVWEIFVGL
jgi:hypothetical protein